MSKAAELAKIGEVATNSQIGGRRNLVINGAMNVAQRATSVTGIGATSGYYTIDRFKLNLASTAGRLTMTQTADGPSGFANCLKLDCTTADTSIAAGENMILQQKFEGQDVQQLKKGTSDAEKITVSFYAKQNEERDIVLALYDSESDRYIGKVVTIGTDWTRHTVTFDGDTTGAITDDNASRFELWWWLHSGTTFTSSALTTTWAASTSGSNLAAGTESFFASTNNTFFITGVQMEVGSVATPFEHRSFGEEFDLCLRYYEKSSAYGVDEDSTAGANIYGVVGMAGSASSVGNNDAAMIHWQKPKRATPTLVFYDAAGNSGKLSYAEAGVGRVDNIAIRSSNIGVNRSRIGTAGASGLDAGEAVEMLFQYTADSEL